MEYSLYEKCFKKFEYFIEHYLQFKFESAMPWSSSCEPDTRVGLCLGWRFINSIYPKLLNPTSSIIFPRGFFLYKRETKLTWSTLTLKLWSWPEICLREFVRGTEPWLVSRDSLHSWTSAIFLQILNRVWGDKSKSILSQDTINRSQFTDPINNSPPPWYNISGLNIIQIWYVVLGRLPYSYNM